MPDPILETKNLTKRYGDFSAASDVSIKIETGTIHGVIGPNGAGKTTLFNCLAGTTPLTSGKILFEGRDISQQPQHARPRLGIGRSFQVTSLFQELSVFENLRLAWQAPVTSKGFVFWHSIPKTGEHAEAIGCVLARVSLSKEAQTVAGALSHGQQRLLEVAMALMAQPRILLLDEPTSGMGIDDVPAMVGLLKELKEECTIVLIEHNVGLVADVCDVVTVMQSGAIVATGTPGEISRNDAVKTAYLGVDL